jgi:hypothetical protein
MAPEGAPSPLPNPHRSWLARIEIGRSAVARGSFVTGVAMAFFEAKPASVEEILLLTGVGLWAAGQPLRHAVAHGTQHAATKPDCELD